MSAWLDKAEEICTRLETLSALAGVEVMIDRQADVASKVALAVGKVSSAGIVTILWTSGQPVADSAPVVSTGQYLIRIYAKPILQAAEAVPADELAEAIVGALHGYNPDPSEHCDAEFRIVGPIDLVADKRYLIYEFTCECRVTLPVPEILPPPP